ncbi:zinc-ribbon domain-containing protein [Clostridium sp. SYSU_GA19001]|uniref:zinc-ribbon domain-containing protein n=1 Tax=Clostridium caldaquaticum TaxID=2940653 RepID=UPI0020777F1F|nr:zinc-ribbon domain-containing protein [Clostridium caldaquaticum]MCM8709634.1 zinc-ribbon domain-containing protein [Clostridium caldaquaticum]
MPIIDNLSKVGKFLEEEASNVAQKTGTLYEISKLNISISQEEKKIEDICIKIGHKIYKDYKEKKINDKNLIDKCEEIEKIEKIIESLKKKILKLKDKKQCKKCGAEMERRAAFCPECGKEQ